jgi:hypothetical protein
MSVDEEIRHGDEAYLAKHEIKELMSAMLREVVTRKPLDPVQYLVDYLSMDPARAAQDANGLSAYRRGKLLDVFKAMDADGDGKVTLDECRGFTSKHGGHVLSEEEVANIFGDVDSSMDSLIDEEEFAAFFARSMRALSNEEFDRVIADMLL